MLVKVNSVAIKKMLQKPKKYIISCWLHLVSYLPLVLNRRRCSKISNFSTNQKPWWPSWMLDKVTRHNLRRGSSKEYHIQVWSNLPYWFLRKDQNVKS